MNKTYKKIKKITKKLYILALIGSLLIIPLEGFSILLIVFACNMELTTIFELIDYCIDNKKETVEEYKPINYDKCRKEISKSAEPPIEKERKLIIIDRIKELEQKIQITNNKTVLEQLKIELTRLQFLLNDLLSEDEKLVKEQIRLNKSIIKEINNKIISSEINETNKNFKIFKKGTIN